MPYKIHVGIGKRINSSGPLRGQLATWAASCRVSRPGVPGDHLTSEGQLKHTQIYDIYIYIWYLYMIFKYEINIWHINIYVVKLYIYIYVQVYGCICIWHQPVIYTITSIQNRTGWEHVHFILEYTTMTWLIAHAGLSVRFPGRKRVISHMGRKAWGPNPKHKQIDVSFLLVQTHPFLLVMSPFLFISLHFVWHTNMSKAKLAPGKLPRTLQTRSKMWRCKQFHTRPRSYEKIAV